MDVNEPEIVEVPAELRGVNACSTCGRDPRWRFTYPGSLFRPAGRRRWYCDDHLPKRYRKREEITSAG